MSSFRAPVAEQAFVLRTLAGVADEMADAVLEGAGQFAEEVFAPVSRIGDTVGATLVDGAVRTAPGFPDAYRAFVEGGWGTISAPEAHGGQGLPFALQVAVLDSLGAANTALTLAPILSGAAVEALIHHGTSEQQASFLPKLVSGEWTGTMNLTEPQAGSDVGALRTRATPRPDGNWSIKGTKIFISFGDHDMAENILHLVLARTPDAPAGTRGISLFLVPKVRADGTANDLRAVSIEHKLGLHGSPTCVMSYGDEDDCTGELIGPEHGGMRAMFTMMNQARLLVGLQGVQVAERATQAAVDYARTRVQSVRAGAADKAGVAIVEHPDVRRMLLRMRALTDAIRALVYYTAGQTDLANGGDAEAAGRVALLTPLAKAYPTDIGCEVASLAIQVHGGMGFVEETGVAQHYRDARVFPIYEGTNGIQAADLVGRKLTLENGAPVAALLEEMARDAHAEPLRTLVAAVEERGRALAAASHDDRLAASVPFQTMFATAVCGWLLEREVAAADEASLGAQLALKRAAVAFYLHQIVPEALGLIAAASAPAAALYAVAAEEFA